jgi:Xaa-Pro aminopeptidase
MAAQITADAQIDVLRAVRPGLLEGELRRVVDAAFQRAGAAPAFAHIVASGPNALVLHYDGDSRELADGDVVVVDIGAAFDEHCSDVSRTYAASGSFTKRQREIYELVLDVQQTVAAEARPGDTLSSLDARARVLFVASKLRARKNQVAGLLPMDQFFVHALSHFVGRRVHGEDTGLTRFDPLRPGQVLTIEPGIYIELEGLGVRIEDTYLVTATGLECLTCACPKQLRDIERGM